MAVRNQSGPSFGGSKHRPAQYHHAGSLRTPTNGPGPRHNGWNGQNNRSHNFISHKHNNFGAQSQDHPQNVSFRQFHPHRRQNRHFQDRQGGGFNGPNQIRPFQNHASSENSVPFQTGFQDQLRAPKPRGPKNRRRRNRQFQENIHHAVHNIEMGDIINTSNLDTDIEMPDAPPLECYRLENWINEPNLQQNLLVAEGIASANAILARIEYFVRTGTMPVENFNLNSH